MGLTIHYGLKTNQTTVDAIRSVVQNIHSLAKQLPFQEVGDVVEFQGDECDHNKQDDENRWLAIQAGQYIEVDGHHAKITPLHIIAFTTIPGEGSELANIGLALYPEFFEIARPQKRQVPTGLTGWSWRSFCKTQYASSPSCGGVPNFVRCHLSIIELLDAIQKRQLAEVQVHDEGDYWELRDVRKLAETVGEWNEMVAAVAGQLKDAAAGFQMEAPITQFPSFERLEARGRDKLDKRQS